MAPRLPRVPGWRQVLAGAVADLPGVRALVAREKGKISEKIRADMEAKAAAAAASIGPAYKELPAAGLPAEEVRRRMAAKVRGPGREASAGQACTLIRWAGRGGSFVMSALPPLLAFLAVCS